MTPDRLGVCVNLMLSSLVAPSCRCVSGKRNLDRIGNTCRWSARFLSRFCFRNVHLLGRLEQKVSNSTSSDLIVLTGSSSPTASDARFRAMVLVVYLRPSMSE